MDVEQIRKTAQMRLVINADAELPEELWKGGRGAWVWLYERIFQELQPGRGYLELHCESRYEAQRARSAVAGLSPYKLHGYRKRLPEGQRLRTSIKAAVHLENGQDNLNGPYILTIWIVPD